MRKLCSYFGGAVILATLVCVFIAYFTTSTDPVSHQWFDGFGRPLSESPWFVRMVFGSDRLWPGWFWFFVDLVMFWTGLAIGVVLVNFGLAKSEEQPA